MAVCQHECDIVVMAPHAQNHIRVLVAWTCGCAGLFTGPIPDPAEYARDFMEGRRDSARAQMESAA